MWVVKIWVLTAKNIRLENNAGTHSIIRLMYLKISPSVLVKLKQFKISVNFRALYLPKYIHHMLLVAGYNIRI